MGCDSITLFCLLLAQNFNPRTHVGCDGGQTPQTPSRGNFNPRTHVGCDIPSTQVSERDTVFQSTHPRGVRQLARLTSIVTKNFNPRTHVGCDGCWRRRRPPTRYFNPRTHVGCDLGHQPDYIAAVGISIHAPTWGATSRAMSKAIQLADFNPRTHVGCDLSVLCGMVAINHFNPRTHVGCDSSASVGETSVSHFNPRTHVGCDGSAGASLSLIFYFNPRTHVGCDLPADIAAFVFPYISIHAPTWGATRMYSSASSTVLFQSTHPRGVRLLSHQMVGF